ncbi:MAG: hypothetical protein IKW92_01580 [Firmicutes bacterium]|nr:hypothetical protein [Bacillota bacterium]
MNNDYGYNNNDKPRRSGKFQEWMIKYNKILWALLILFAMYTGRGSFSNLIHTFRDWDEIQAAKGDVILQQHLFIRDRLYLEDPAEYSDVIQLENGTYSHNVRVGSDITLDQEKFVFDNGDTYRHITLPYVETVSIMDIDTLKMITRFRYDKGDAYYYDAEKDKWEHIGRLRGGTALPQNTLMYMTFNDEHYVLIDQLYAYEEEDEGVYTANSELTHLSHSNIRGSGVEILQPFSIREGMEYQSWTLESSEPLIDVESGEVLPGMDVTEKELILKDLGLGNGVRWLSDAFYEPVPEGYTPYGEDNYYRSDNAQQLDLLLEAQDSRAAQELAFLNAYKMAQNVSENGYFETPIQNSQLYGDYGIRYGYADLKANAQIGQKLVTAAKAFGKDGFEEAIRSLADFYRQRLSEGALPEYWHYKGEIKTVPASADTKKEIAAFLNAAAELLGDSSYKALAELVK